MTNNDVGSFSEAWMRVDALDDSVQTKSPATDVLLSAMQNANDTEHEWNPRDNEGEFVWDDCAFSSLESLIADESDDDVRAVFFPSWSAKK
jgi:hypothetical protein